MKCLIKLCQFYREYQVMVPAKLHGKRLTSELTSKWITFKNIQSIFTLSSSITFEVLNQTLPNLQGNCRNTLQNYMENGWELTSESTSKWITFKNIQCSLITFEVLNQTLPNLQGSCRNTSRWCLQNYMELRIDVWIDV